MVYVYPPRWKWILLKAFHWLPCKLDRLHSQTFHDNGDITCWYCGTPLNEQATPEYKQAYDDEIRRWQLEEDRKAEQRYTRRIDANRSSFFRHEHR